MKTLEDIELAENDRAAVMAAAAVLSKSFPVERVILFGSAARGQDEKRDPQLRRRVRTVRHRPQSFRISDLPSLPVRLGTGSSIP